MRRDQAAFACAAFHFSRASRCSLAESSLRCLSQMYPNRGPRDMFLQPSTRQRMSRWRPPSCLARARQLGGRHLDMRCRVEGCKNMSRGPRFGYICDKHRKELSAKEQREAREKWNAAHAKAA